MTSRWKVDKIVGGIPAAKRNIVRTTESNRRGYVGLVDSTVPEPKPHKKDVSLVLLFCAPFEKITFSFRPFSLLVFFRNI